MAGWPPTLRYAFLGAIAGLSATLGREFPTWLTIDGEILRDVFGEAAAYSAIFGGAGAMASVVSGWFAPGRAAGKR